MTQNPFPLVPQFPNGQPDPVLRELAEVAAEQHEATQAGSTTTPIEAQTILESKPKFVLGSVGRFADPVYGMIRSRYVQFTQVTDAVGPFAVGLVKGTNRWLASNRKAASKIDSIIGIAFVDSKVQQDEIGWVQVEGTNTVPLVITGDSPVAGDAISWADDNGLEFSDSAPLAELLTTKDMVTVGNQHTVPAGGIWINPQLRNKSSLDGNPSVEKINENIKSLEDQLSDLVSNTDLFLVEQRFNGLTDNLSRLVGVDITKLERANFLLQQRVDSTSDDATQLALQQTLATIANYARTTESNADAAASARNSVSTTAIAVAQDRVSVETFRNEAGVFAESTLVALNQAAVKSNEALTFSEIAQTSSVEASDSAASASLSERLSVAYGSFPGINPNPEFTLEKVGWYNAYNTPFDDFTEVQAEYRASHGGRADVLYFAPGRQDIGSDLVAVDSSKDLRVECGFQIEGVPARPGICVGCYDESKAFLGFAYARGTVDGNLNTGNDSYAVGWHDYGGYIAMENGNVEASRFSPGTKYIRIANILNSDNNLSARVNLDYHRGRFVEVGDAAVDVQARADIVTEQQARVDADNAISSSVTTLTTRVGDNESDVSVLFNSVNGIESEYAVRLTAQGRIGGFGLINDGNLVSAGWEVDEFKINILGSDVPVFDVNAKGLTLNTELYMGDHEIIFDNGVAMKVMGVGFGANNDLLEWFGPSQAVNLCTKANAVAYESTDGTALYLGDLGAGNIVVQQNTTSLASNAEIVIGPFGTNGDNKLVTLELQTTANVNQPHPFTCPVSPASPSASVIIERSFDGSTWTTLAGPSPISGNYLCTSSAGPGEDGNITESIAGFLQTTDTNTTTSDFYYRARIVSRTTNVTPQTQQLKIRSIEAV